MFADVRRLVPKAEEIATAAIAATAARGVAAAC